MTNDNGPRTTRHLLIAGGGLALVLGLLGAVSERLLEKAATNLVLPCGACCMGLALCAYFAALNRQRVLAWLLAGTWLAYTLAGNGLIGHWLLCSLERPYYGMDPLHAEPVDQLVVLGGTVGVLENGVAQIGNGGDRAVLAARLYHRGKTRRLVATGALTTPAGLDNKGGAKATAQIWQDLGVPASAIAMIGGQNTLEEIRNLKTLLDEDTRFPRVGLVTSAWHMSRALRLAKQEGLDVIPVPADFATRAPPPTWDEVLLGLIPSGNGFANTQRALKERLAGLVGR